MANREFTLFELHLHSDGDVQVGPRALGRGTEAENEGGRSLRGAVLAGGALVVLSLLVVAVWRASRAR